MKEYQTDDDDCKVATSIRQKVDTSLFARDSSNCCIYRVPEWLRKVNEDAYRPMLVSIGPYHYNKDSKLTPMEAEKLRYLDSFLERNPAYTLETYVKDISRMEKEIHECYEEKIELPHEEFIGMILTDAAFIIELFLKICFNEHGANDRMCRMAQGAIRDIKQEENQLPLFVLNHLYSRLRPPYHGERNYPSSFEELTVYMLVGKVNYNGRSSDDKSKHIVHLLQNSYIDRIIEPEISIPSASKLSQAGVKFKSNPDKGFLSINFNEKTGLLEIPKFQVEDGTESLFRNIMAFESCHFLPPTNSISSYFVFLDDLIDTVKDVELLADENIIVNHLGSHEELVNLINMMCKEIHSCDKCFRYTKTYEELNFFIQKKWSWHRYINKIKTAWKTKYFNHPWTGISVIYAFVILILTILQTISGFKSDNNNNNKTLSKP